LILVSLAVLAASTSTNFEVLVFRGQLPLMTAHMNFDEISTQGIVLRDIQLSEVAKNTEQAWKDVVFSSSETAVVLPLRRTTQWTSKTTAHLGVILQSNYRTDTKDEFQISLAFGLCNNNFAVNDFVVYLAKLEEKRQSNSARLSVLFSNVKKEASNFIAASINLDDLLNDHVDNQERLEELKRINVDLLAQLDDLNKLIKEKESEEYESEKKFGQACSSAKISEARVFSFSNEKSTFQEQVKILEAQINSSSAFTEEERAEYDSAYANIVKSIDELAHYNAKKDGIKVEKGKLLEPERLRPYFS